MNNHTLNARPNLAQNDQKAPQTLYALIDSNNFFVSCERLFRPDILNTPTLVLSSNDGCAVARSNEAKALGIKMGEPLHELGRRFSIVDGTTMQPLTRSSLPRVVVFSANFELYGDISRRVATVLARVTPRLELYSIDEAFLDISQLAISDYAMWGRALAAKIEHDVGIPVSVGIAPTKTLCKLAADYAKKHRECQASQCLRIVSVEIPVRSAGASEQRVGECGLPASEATMVPEESEDSQWLSAGRPAGQAMLADAQSRGRGTWQASLREWKTVLNLTPLQDIWGVGWRLAPRLKAVGIHTAADLAAMAPRHAQQLMGVHGRRMVAELNGISCIPLSSTHKPQQVISRGRQFGRDTNDGNTVAAAVARMTNHACRALRREGLLATGATVWLMTNRKKPGFTVFHRDTRFYTPTADTGTVAHQLINTLRRDFDARHSWHKAEVTLWNLVPSNLLQIDVFGIVNPDAHARSVARMTVVDAVNQKHGAGTLRYAAEDLSHAWYPRRAMQSPASTTTWSELPSLQTGRLEIV